MEFHIEKNANGLPINLGLLMIFTHSLIMLCYAFAFLETGYFSLQLYNTIPAGSIIFADLKNDFFLVSHSILYLISLFRRSLYQIICRHNCWICRLTISLEWMLPLLRFWAERTSMICIFMCWLILQVLLDFTTG